MNRLTNILSKCVLIIHCSGGEYSWCNDDDGNGDENNGTDQRERQGEKKNHRTFRLSAIKNPLTEWRHESNNKNQKKTKSKSNDQQSNYKRDNEKNTHAYSRMDSKIRVKMN